MDTKRREKILEIYKDIEDVLQMDDNFRHVITTEFDHVTKDLNKLGSTLRSIECPILIAGIACFLHLFIHKGRSIINLVWGNWNLTHHFTET